ncbi:dipeptidase [Salarchaeum japonicum]|uniref:Membrane dipeptidase n=1 Tax=Salarchaeum japonicum TaxID=555573 RepID=A0AAV3T3E8_9EURY|nr:membrane dipeptidase [Salarchaeum japonicum]
MGRDKRYDQYESYDYLDDDAYEQFDLPAVHAGFDPYEVPLSDDEEARLNAVLDDTVISLHDHPFYFPEHLSEDIQDYIRAGRARTAFEALSETPLDAVFDMHLDGLSHIHSHHGWKWSEIVHDVTMRAADIQHSDYGIRASGVEDIERARENGQLAFVPALESAAMIENELDRLDQLYGMGIRSIGVTYDASNSLGAGKGGVYEVDGGLTTFGVDAIARMNDLGLAVSTSHASKQTTLDVCDVTVKPIFDTHALAQGAGMGKRGTSDEELEAIAATGGVIGLLSSAHLPSIDEYMEHFEYLVDLVGIDHVAFGPDVLYGDHTELLRVLAADQGVELPESTLQTEYVRGLENPTEAWQNIPRWLVKEGYSDRDIEKILGENILRVLDETWA